MLSCWVRELARAVEGALDRALAAEELKRPMNTVPTKKAEALVRSGGLQGLLGARPTVRPRPRRPPSG